MRNSLLTILVLFVLQTCALAFDSSIKFVQVTDVHFGRKHDYNVEVLKKTVDDINKLKGISFVVFTGDNIDNPIPEDLADFVKIVNKLKRPYYLVLGNHDVFKNGNLSKERYREIVRENNFFWMKRGWNYTFKKNGYLFIVLDGSKEVVPGPVGYYRDDTLAWLDKQISKHPKTPVVIFQHYPIINSPDFGARARTHKVYQPEKYYKVLSKHKNVLAIITGHFHTNSETMENGIYHIVSPSLLSQPNRYKIIDIVSKQGLSPIIYTQLKEVNAD